jgi:steroid delta-isomerase
MPTTDEMKAAVQAYTAAHTAKDAEAIVALFSPDCVVADPVDRPEMVGREEVREFFAGTHQMSDGFELKITGPIRAVDRFAAVPLRAETSMGGSTFAVDIIDLFTFGEDGLITEMRAYWTASDIQQL